MFNRNLDSLVVTFLRRILPGGVSDSFGIDVARLAGIPARVTARANGILKQLESGHISTPQLSLFTRQNTETQSSASLKKDPEHPIIETLKNLDIDQMSPREAQEKLYSWQKGL